MYKCICIDIPKDWIGSEKLEVGKIYSYLEVLRPKYKTKFVIIDEDSGKLMSIQHHWFKVYFKTINQLRNEQIEKLLES